MPHPIPAIAILPPPPNPTVTNTPLPEYTTLEKSEVEGLIIRFAYNDATMSPLFDLGYEITGYASGEGGGLFSHSNVANFKWVVLFREPLYWTCQLMSMCVNK